MSSGGLPHRAKPPLLHEICLLAREYGEVSKSDVYDSIDENQKTLRKTLDYGVELGFLREDGDRYELTGRGSVLGYSPSFEGQDSIVEAFREAIKEFPPYREAIIGVHERNETTTVKERRVIERDALKAALSVSVGAPVEDREANLLVKTAEAAGLGEYKAGRRSYQTRLILDDEFDEFVSRLAEEYPLPREERPDELQEQEEPAVTDQGATESEIGPEPGQSSLVDTGTAPDSGPGNGVNLTVHLDVSGKSEEEIARIIKRLQRGDI